MLFKKLWRSTFRWTMPGKARTLPRTTKNPIITPLRHISIEKLPILIRDYTLHDAHPKSTTLTKTRLSEDSHLHDPSTPPSFISNPDPFEPPTEPNEVDDIDNFQIFRATRLKSVSLLPTTETIAPGNLRQEVSLDLTPFQSTRSVLIPTPVSSPGSETPPLLPQGELLDIENCDDVSVRLPAGAPCPDKKDAEAPVDLVGSTGASLAVLPSAASTFKGPTSAIRVPRIYDYNVTRTGPAYRTPRSTPHRPERKSLTIPAYYKQPKNPSANPATEESEVNSIPFPNFPNSPLEPTAQPVISSAPSTPQDLPRVVLRQRYHSSPADIPLNWTPSGSRHMYHVYRSSPEPVQWTYMGTHYGPPPDGITGIMPAHLWGYAEGWYYSNDGHILIQHRGLARHAPEMEDSEHTLAVACLWL
jgi:hypothetical protein